MGMLQRVQNGDFLGASLDITCRLERGRWLIQGGVCCELLGRGILQITPVHLDGGEKDIVLSAGIHGDETGPVEIMQRLVQQILTGVVKPSHRMLCIIGHPEALNLQQRFVTENMNRLFKQKNTDLTPDAVRANDIQTAIAAFYNKPDSDLPTTTSSIRWHLDLHSAIRDSKHYTFAVSPATNKPTRSTALFAFLQQAGVEAALLSNLPSSTLSWFSAEHFGAQALTLELGRVAKFGENNLRRLDDLFHALIELVTEPKPRYQWKENVLTVYKVTRTLIKHSDLFQFHFPEQQANFTFFEQGRLLAHDQGVEYYALNGGEAVVFPNRHVAVGQRACLLVRETVINIGEQVTLQ